MARRPSNGSAFSEEQLKMLAPTVHSDIDTTNERLLLLVRNHFDQGLTVHARFEEALAHVYAMGMQFAMNNAPKRKRTRKAVTAAQPTDA